jgi:pimeloyl-ACP methyl ester carboxylesterase
VLYSHCITQATVSKPVIVTMPKADNRTPRDAINGTASQDVLKLSDSHTITYHTIGDASLPLMLFVVGSSGLGSLYRRLSIELSTTFRCVHYDKRGFLPADIDKTSFAKQTNQLVLASQSADDAAALIKHISPDTPVCVFGTSTGGTAVLDLVLRYPELIHTAVLHEPVTFSVMPSSELKDEILALYRCLPYFDDQVEGSKAYASFMFRPHSPETSSGLHASLSRVDQDQGVMPERSTLPAESAAAFNARQGEQEGAAMLAYEVDVHRARSVKDKLLLICGDESKGWPISQPVNDLARALGHDVKVWQLAGDHLSFAARRRVVTFAEQLVGILRQEGRVSFSTDSEPKSRM